MKITTSCGHPWGYIVAELGDRAPCRECGGAMSEILAVDRELPAAGRTFDNAGRELGAGDILNAAALVARLQAHALGTPCMDSTQVTAAGKLLDSLAKRPEPPPPVAATLTVPSDVSDDDALQAYLKMIDG